MLFTVQQIFDDAPVTYFTRRDDADAFVQGMNAFDSGNRWHVQEIDMDEPLYMQAIEHFRAGRYPFLVVATATEVTVYPAIPNDTYPYLTLTYRYVPSGSSEVCLIAAAWLPSRDAALLIMNNVVNGMKLFRGWPLKLDDLARNEVHDFSWLSEQHPFRKALP